MYFHRFSSSDYWFNQMYYGTHGPFKRAEGGQAITFENDKVHNFPPSLPVKTTRFHIFHSRISITRALKFGVVGVAVQFPVGKVAGIVSQLELDQNYQNNRLHAAVLCRPPADQQYHLCNNILFTPLKHRVTTVSTPLGPPHHHCCRQ